MALKLDIEKIFDGADKSTTLSEVQVKVDCFYGNKNNTSFDILWVKDNTILFSGRHNFTPDIEKPLLTQAYEYLKTLDEYSDAIDC